MLKNVIYYCQINFYVLLVISGGGGSNSVKAISLNFIHVVLYCIQNSFLYILPFAYQTTLRGGKEDGHLITV